MVEDNYHFKIIRHAYSCNNANKGKSAFGKDFEPSLTDSSIYQTIKNSEEITKDAESNQTNQTNLFVSPLLRTWCTAVLLYGTKSTSNNLETKLTSNDLNLIVSPYLKELGTDLSTYVKKKTMGTTIGKRFGLTTKDDVTHINKTEINKTEVIERFFDYLLLLINSLWVFSNNNPQIVSKSILIKNISSLNVYLQYVENITLISCLNIIMNELKISHLIIGTKNKEIQKNTIPWGSEPFIYELFKDMDEIKFIEEITTHQLNADEKVIIQKFLVNISFSYLLKNSSTEISNSQITFEFDNNNIIGGGLSSKFFNFIHRQDITIRGNYPKSIKEIIPKFIKFLNHQYYTSPTENIKVCNKIKCLNITLHVLDFDVDDEITKTIKIEISRSSPVEEFKFTKIVIPDRGEPIKNVANIPNKLPFDLDTHKLYTTNGNIDLFVKWYIKHFKNELFYSQNIKKDSKIITITHSGIMGFHAYEFGNIDSQQGIIKTQNSYTVGGSVNNNNNDNNMKKFFDLLTSKTNGKEIDKVLFNITDEQKEKMNKLFEDYSKNKKMPYKEIKEKISKTNCSRLEFDYNIKEGYKNYKVEQGYDPKYIPEDIKNYFDFCLCGKEEKTKKCKDKKNFKGGNKIMKKNNTNKRMKKNNTNKKMKKNNTNKRMKKNNTNKKIKRNNTNKKMKRYN